jgi:putative ABC transport system permease protein
LPLVLPDRTTGVQRAEADAVLARGGVVLFSQEPAAVRTATFVVRGRGSGSAAQPRRVSVPAYVVDAGAGNAPAVMVLSTTAARRLSLSPAPVGVVFDARRLSAEQLDVLEQALTALSPDGANVYVEHGYQVPGAERVVLWILFGLAAVLMLGGTLTATFLALSDARPDLATLAAVGAAPRTRRGVAAAFALSIGIVGAVLGAAVGFIPGIAVSYPLTRSYVPGAPSHYLAIPWTLILGLVVALPLVTALVVGLVARSRLPVVARVD